MMENWWGRQGWKRREEGESVQMLNTYSYIFVHLC